MNAYPNQGQLWPSTSERQSEPNPDPPNQSQDETAGLQVAPRQGAIIAGGSGAIRGPVRESEVPRDPWHAQEEDRGPWARQMHNSM